MDTRRFLTGALLCIAALAFGCSDPEGFNNVPDDCPNAPTNPDCQAYCDTDPTASWCEGGNNNDAGNNTTTDGDTVPCDGACTESQVCDESTDTCVACLVPDDCLDGTCQVDAADSANNACVQCLGTEDCASGVCDTDTNTCVACLADSDCTDPTAARCVTGATPADNACGGCDDSAQCADITGTEVCDAGAGTCVECVADSDCVVGTDTFACSVIDNTCSEIIAGTANGCDECVSDSSCTAGNVCVPLDYMGMPRGNYCMPLVNNASCPPTYGESEIDRETLDGTLATVCLINETNVTCEAVKEFRTACPNGDECSADGSRCETIGALQQCTYTCTGPNDCSTGVDCGGEQPLYCGGD